MRCVVHSFKWFSFCTVENFEITSGFWHNKFSVALRVGCIYFWIKLRASIYPWKLKMFLGKQRFSTVFTFKLKFCAQWTGFMLIFMLTWRNYFLLFYAIYIIIWFATNIGMTVKHIRFIFVRVRLEINRSWQAYRLIEWT